MPRKVTPHLAAEIRRRAAAGDSLREIGRSLGLSPNTCKAALGAPQRPAAPPPPVPPAELEAELEAATEPAEPYTTETLGADLAQQIAELRSDARRARKSGDEVTLARVQRNLTTLAVIAARLARAAPLEQGIVQLRAEDIKRAADECREKLRTLIEHARAEKGTP